MQKKKLKIIIKLIKKQKDANEFNGSQNGCCGQFVPPWHAADGNGSWIKSTTATIRLKKKEQAVLSGCWWNVADCTWKRWLWKFLWCCFAHINSLVQHNSTQHKTERKYHHVKKISQSVSAHTHTHPTDGTEKKVNEINWKERNTNEH